MGLFKKQDKGVYVRVPHKLKKDLNIFLAEEGLTLVQFLTKAIEKRKEFWEWVESESIKNR